MRTVSVAGTRRTPDGRNRLLWKPTRRTTMRELIEIEIRYGRISCLICLSQTLGLCR